MIAGKFRPSLPFLIQNNLLQQFFIPGFICFWKQIVFSFLSV